MHAPRAWVKVTANSKPCPKNVLNVQHVMKIYQALPLLRFFTALLEGECLVPGYTVAGLKDSEDKTLRIESPPSGKLPWTTSMNCPLLSRRCLHKRNMA